MPSFFILKLLLCSLVFVKMVDTIASKSTSCKSHICESQTGPALLRRQNIEPKVELVEQGKELVKRFFLALNLDVAGADFFVQVRFTHTDLVKRQALARYEYFGVSFLLLI